jgi:DNA-binding MarR family transcriptional regulator
MTIARILEEMHRTVHREWMRSGAPLEVSHSEFEYLRAIKGQEVQRLDATAHHGQHLHNIVTEMGVSKASASTMVMKLEKRGLVDRIPCQFDARAQHILVSAKGSAMLAAGETIYARAAEILYQRLGATTYHHLTNALNKGLEDKNEH